MPRFQGRHLVPLADQAILSGANFLASFICLRNLSIDDYGDFAIGLAGAYLTLSCIHGLVANPSSIRTIGWGQVRRDRYSSYDRRTLWLVLLVLNLALFGLALGVAQVAGAQYSESNALFFAVACLAGSGLALMDLDRTYLVHEKRYGSAATLSSAYATVLLGGMLLLASTGGLTATTGLVCLVAATALSCVVRLVLPGAVTVRRRGIVARFKGWQRRGFSSLGLNFIGWAQSNLYLFAVDLIAGPKAVGMLAASRLIFAGMNPFLLALSRFSVPFLVLGDHAGTRHKIISALRSSTALVITLVLANSLIAILGYAYVDRYVFKGKVEDGEIMLATWAIFFLAAGLNSVICNFAAANRHFSELFKTSFIAMWVALVFVSFVAYIGVQFVPLAIVAGELIIFGFAFRLARRELRVR